METHRGNTREGEQPPVKGLIIISVAANENATEVIAEEEKNNEYYNSPGTWHTLASLKQSLDFNSTRFTIDR